MLENVSFLAYLFFEGRKILNIAGRNMRKEKVLGKSAVLFFSNFCSLTRELGFSINVTFQNVICSSCMLCESHDDTSGCRRGVGFHSVVEKKWNLLHGVLVPEKVDTSDCLPNWRRKYECEIKFGHKEICGYSVVP